MSPADHHSEDGIGRARERESWRADDWRRGDVETYRRKQEQEELFLDRCTVTVVPMHRCTKALDTCPWPLVHAWTLLHVGH